MAAAATGMDEPFIMPIGMGLNFLSSQYSDRLLLSTADQCVNTARRHFDARDFFNNPLYSDLKITFTHEKKTTTLFAHRMALHSSSYFENAMSTCWVEESSRHLVIDGVQPDVGRAIVGFLYGQDLEVPQSQLLSTLVAVDRLMLTELEDVCCEHIQSLLSPESALELAAGIAEGCPSMHRSWLAVCSAYIEANEDAIRKTDAFKSISRDQIITMISVRGPPIFLSPVPYVMHWLKAQNEGVRGCASMVGQEQEGGDEEGEGGEDDPSVLVEEAKLVFRAFELLATDPSIGGGTARQHLEDHLADCITSQNAFAFVAASDVLNRGETRDLHGWHFDVCIEYVRVRAKEVLQDGRGLLALTVDQVKLVVGQDRLCASEDVVFDAVLAWALAKTKKGSDGAKKVLKETGVVDLIRFPTMTQDFFHRVVEPSNVVPSRLLLERYQYHHVGFLKYNSSNTRLHHRLPLQGGAGCVRCTDPAHPEGCESWVVRCHPVPESGLGFGGEKLCYRGCEFRTCAGDLWCVTVFPPGTEERELRGAQRLGMTRGDREAAGQKLAHNEWAASLRRLSNDSGTVLTECSAGLSGRFDTTSAPFWDLCTQSGLDISQSSPYTYSSNAWIVWRRTHIAELNPMGVIGAGKTDSGTSNDWVNVGGHDGGDGAPGAPLRELFCEIHFQSFSKGLKGGGE